MRKIIFLFCMLSCTVFGQDTATVLTLNTFLKQVKENHPIAVATGYDVQLAERFIHQSKGSFDPVLFSGIDQKYFNGTTYYSTISSGIKIPTRIGIDLKAMGDWNRGTYLNPELKTPKEGLTYLGAEMQLGRGMFTDERRNQLKRAQNALLMSYANQQLELNDLLYEAGKAFIDWQEQHAQLNLALDGLQLAEERFKQLSVNAEMGDRAYIDTVEASAQLFLRKMEVEQRKLQKANAQLQVENFMWDKGTLPLVLDPSVQPEALVLQQPRLQVLDSLVNHPKLQSIDYKIQDLSIERRLKIEQLKPKFTVNYNLLSPANSSFSSNYSWSNYKWGATFYMPLLLRKERNSLQATNIKIASTQLDFQATQRNLTTKLQQTRNEWNTSVTQAQMAATIADRYQVLSEGERTLFINGDSNLFLVNAREISYLSARGKYYESLAKTNKFFLTEQYVRGILAQ